MMQKRILGLLAAVLVLTLLAGCGAESAMSKAEAGGYDNGMSATMAASDAELSESIASGQTVSPVNQKLIRTVRMSAQTQDMDSLLSAVETRIGELGGYVESRNIYNGTSAYRKNRTASMTIRIPAEKLDQFVNRVGEVSNIVSHSESTEDVSLTYVSTESRIKALETEEARLLELVAAAKDLDDLLTLETRLTKIRTELEQHKSQLRLYDSLVSYSTIHLSVEEVVEYTVVEEEEPSFWKRLGDGFVGAVETVWMLVKEFAIFIVTAIPFLVLPTVVLTAILLPKHLRRKKQKKQEKTKE